MAILGVIFDLDGTFIETNPHHVEAWRRALADFGHAVQPAELWPQMGKGGDQMVPHLMGEAVEAREGKALRERHAVHYKEIAAAEHFRVFPGSREILAELKRRGVRTALATSSKPDHLDATFGSCGEDFRKLVDVTTDASDAERSKPHPDLIHAALSKIGLPAEHCAMVGDTPYDAAASKPAGVRFWGVTCGGFGGADLLAAGAEAVFADPADLLAQIDPLLAEGPAATPGGLVE